MPTGDFNMKVCHCALPSMSGNSDCCKYCGNNNYNQSTFTNFKLVSLEPYIKPTKKEIIEKFDELGKLIERITRDV